MVLAVLISPLRLLKAARRIAGYRLGGFSSRGVQVSRPYCTAGNVSSKQLCKTMLSPANTGPATVLGNTLGLPGGRLSGPLCYLFQQLACRRPSVSTIWSQKQPGTQNDCPHNSYELAELTAPCPTNFHSPPSLAGGLTVPLNPLLYTYSTCQYPFTDLQHPSAPFCGHTAFIGTLP